ncbi:MAG TPA: RHS repeat-associated core domain-containing protein, partial [Treponemataceae bacterium]|nr:RHS repeat-associated core domain-containing protein [Treponemataceae bacterium]
VPVQRYQLDNHLGSASLELDDSANIVSYEEYYPYGDTSYRAGRTASEVSQKRYRYTGKEKDEESGLYYHGARYYACWLGRWTASDPAGLVDGVNLYMYVRGNPVSGVDPSGTQTVKNDDQLINAPKVKEKAQRTVGSDNLAKALLNAENEELSVASVDSFANEAKEMVTFVAKAIKKYKIDRFIEKMVYHHLSMVRENENDKENHKEISAIGTNLRNLNTIYIGFYDKERKTHTMGSEFGDSLSVSTKAFKNSNPNEKLLVFHLHPWQNAGKTSFILGQKERNSMFSFPGDHDNMKDGQIWVGIEVLTRKDGSYFYDVHVSGKALGIQSIPIYRGEIDVNKCAPQLFKKEIQMTK